MAVSKTEDERFDSSSSCQRKEINMESVLALVISAISLAGTFFAGVSYGKDSAYDEAIRNTAKLYEEVYKEDMIWK